MKKRIFFICFQIFILSFFSKSVADNINRDPREKDIANVFWKSEYTLFDFLTDEPILPNKNGLYDIWYSSNENPTPNHNIFDQIELASHHYYKFKNEENCKKWCDSKNSDIQLNNSSKNSISNESENNVEGENVSESAINENEETHLSETKTKSSINSSNDEYKPSNVIEYYKVDKDIAHIIIYLDHKYSENNAVTEFDCIPFSDEGSYQEKSELNQNFFGKTIVEIIETHGKYGKIKIDNKDWWIRMESLVKLSDSEVQEYLKEQSDQQNKNEYLIKISNMYNNSPILFWTLVGLVILLLIVVIVFFVRLSQRCNVCKKWGAVKNVNKYKDLRDMTSTTLRRAEQITDVYGKKHTNYYYVPATRKTYDHLDEYECKYCGNKTEKRYTSSKTTED